jgi:hypothetical protein
VKYTYLLVVLVFILSCQDNRETDKVKKPKPLMSLVETHPATENVLPAYLKEVKDWKELHAIDSFFVKFRKITPNEALSNAVELKDLIQRLNDSIKPENFKAASLTARINILYNEALRLADLTEIGAIKAQEVNAQVAKTMAAFSNVNTKINNTLAKIRFEEEVAITVTFIGLDTSKLDSISKNSLVLKPIKRPAKKKIIFKDTKTRKQ